VAVQPDGGLVYAFLSSNQHQLAGYRIFHFNLGRALGDGTVDATFGDGGTVTPDLQGPGNAHPLAMALQGDGKLIVAGDAWATYDFFNFPGTHFAVARYNADGTLDRTFGSGGLVTADFSGTIGDVNAGATAVAVQPDGKVVIAGRVSDPTLARPAAGLIRLNADGSLDAGFGAGGKVLATGSPMPGAMDMALQADGRIVIAGEDNGGSGNLVVARFNGDGSPDLDFGSAGSATTPVSAQGIWAGWFSPRPLAIQDDGRIVAAGVITTDDPDSPPGVDQSFALVRLNPDGSPDASFGPGGIAVASFGPGRLDNPSAILLQPDGKILAAGATSVGWGPGVYALARFNPDGSLDASFGGGGEVATDFGQDDWVTSIALQSDGRIVAGGVSTDDPAPNVASTYSHFALARYNPDGGLDAGFGAGGLVTTSFGADLS
jgi:uncharacterized delta-60 repeat protein